MTETTKNDFVKRWLADDDNVRLYEFVKKYWPHWKLGYDGERIVFNTYNRLFDSDSIDEFAEETRMRIEQAHYSEEYGLTLSFTKIGDRDK